MVKSAAVMMKRPQVQLLVVSMAFTGVEMGFWQTIYPTCIGATKVSLLRLASIYPNNSFCHFEDRVRVPPNF